MCTPVWKTQYLLMRVFETFTVVMFQVEAFWVVTPYSVVTSSSGRRWRQPWTCEMFLYYHTLHGVMTHKNSTFYIFARCAIDVHLLQQKSIVTGRMCGATTPLTHTSPRPVTYLSTETTLPLPYKSIFANIIILHINSRNSECFLI
jgi:hypothetical protein